MYTSITHLFHRRQAPYAGSLVLGLNDALVELTGALAGYTLALKHTRLIALVGIITGIAATLSMAASAYLSTKEDATKNPFTAAAVTGVSYLGTVLLLVTPYLLFTNPYHALGTTLIVVFLVILGFSYYIAKTKKIPLRQRFWEMISISLGIAAINFVIGLGIKSILPVTL